MNNILLLSKEILRPKTYLSCYGSKLYNTPNIDFLAEQGTKFTNFYTATPSSAMSFTSMFSGLNPYETKRKSYKMVQNFTQCPTMSDILDKRGYEIHVMFGSKWYKTSHKRSRVFCENTIFHPLENIHQQVFSPVFGGIPQNPGLAACSKRIQDGIDFVGYLHFLHFKRGCHITITRSESVRCFLSQLYYTVDWWVFNL